MSDKSDLSSDGSFSQIKAEAEGLDGDTDSCCFEDVVAASVIVELPPSHRRSVFPEGPAAEDQPNLEKGHSLNLNNSQDEVASGVNVASLFNDCTEDMKDEVSSCWSEISTFDKAATDDQHSVASSSYYHISTDMSIGSFGSTFEKISLSSGIVVYKCVRCSFRNSMEDKVCAMCNIALVANPYPDQDLQISLNLQNKEKQNDETFVRLREARRSGLFSAAPLERASFLVEDIQSYLRAYPDVHRLPWVDMRNQAMSFITKSLRSKTRHWYIGCVFTQADDLTFDLIASLGFKPSSNSNFKSQLAVSGSITDAWKYYTALSPDHRPGRQLFSIQEQVVEDPATFSVHELNGTGWLVAAPKIESQEDNTVSPAPSRRHFIPMFRGSIQKVRASETLPLVAFSCEHVDRPDLSMMQNGLKTILEDFFEAAMGPESNFEAAMRPESKGLAATNPRVTRPTFIEQYLRLNGEENKKASVKHSDGTVLKLRDAARSELFSAALLEQASFLAEDIRSYLGAYPDAHRLPLVDMRSQAMGFIKESLRSKTRSWFIGCVFTQADDLTFYLTVRQGFKPSSKTNFKSQLAVAGSISDAWKYYTALPPDNRPGRQLFSTQEQEVEDTATFSADESNGTGWLVAVPKTEPQDEDHNVSQAMPILPPISEILPPRHHLFPMFRQKIKSVRASETLPLVAFSCKHLDKSDLSLMQNGLKTILEDFFEAAMGPESDGPAAANPRVTQPTTIEQKYLRLNREENTKTSVEHSDEKRLQVELPDGPRKNAPTNSLSTGARGYAPTATFTRDVFGTPTHNPRQTDMIPRPPARRGSVEDLSDSSSSEFVDSGSGSDSDSNFLSDDMDETSITLESVMLNALFEYIEWRKIFETGSLPRREAAQWHWNGHVAPDYKTKTGVALGIWVKKQLNLQKQGLLNADLEDMLRGLGLRFEEPVVKIPLSDEGWESSVDTLTSIISQQNMFHPPARKGSFEDLLDSKRDDSEPTDNADEAIENVMIDALLEYIDWKRRYHTKSLSRSEAEEWCWNGCVPQGYVTKTGVALGKWTEKVIHLQREGLLNTNLQELLVGLGLRFGEPLPAETILPNPDASSSAGSSSAFPRTTEAARNTSSDDYTEEESPDFGFQPPVSTWSTASLPNHHLHDVTITSDSAPGHGHFDQPGGNQDDRSSSDSGL